MNRVFSGNELAGRIGQSVKGNVSVLARREQFLAKTDPVMKGRPVCSETALSQFSKTEVIYLWAGKLGCGY